MSISAGAQHQVERSIKYVNQGFGDQRASITTPLSGKVKIKPGKTSATI